MCHQCQKQCPEQAGQNQTNLQAEKSPSVPVPVVPYLLLIDVVNPVAIKPADVAQKVKNLVERNEQLMRSSPLDVLRADYYEKPQVVAEKKADLEGLQVVLEQAKKHHLYLVELNLYSSFGEVPHSLLRHSQAYITELKLLIKALKQAEREA